MLDQSERFALPAIAGEFDRFGCVSSSDTCDPATCTRDIECASTYDTIDVDMLNRFENLVFVAEQLLAVVASVSKLLLSQRLATRSLTLIRFSQLHF